MDLMKAAELGDINKVRKLLNRNADVDLKNKNGLTALMEASCAGHINVVKELLNHNANVDLTTIAPLALAAALLPKRGTFI